MDKDGGSLAETLKGFLAYSIFTLTLPLFEGRGVMWTSGHPHSFSSKVMWIRFSAFKEAEQFSGYTFLQTVDDNAVCHFCLYFE